MGRWWVALCVLLLAVLAVGCVSSDTKEWVGKVADLEAHYVDLIQRGETTEAVEGLVVATTHALWKDADGFRLGMPGEAKTLIDENLKRTEAFIMLAEGKERTDYQQEIRESAAGWRKLDAILSPDDVVLPGASKGGAE
jgi:hypothetical protein